MDQKSPLLSWFGRAITVLNAEAERGHGGRVQRRSWVAAGAAPYAKSKTFSPTRVGAVDYLEALPRDEGGHGASKLLADLIPLAGQLPWTPSARVDDAGAEVALVDLFECIDIKLTGAGIMVLGPGQGYPEHAHPPAELYLVLHGSRRWRFGDSERYLKVDQGQVLSNSPMDVHGIEAGDDPLVALWVLIDEPTDVPAYLPGFSP